MKMVKAECPECGTEQRYAPALLKRSPIQTLQCEECRLVFKPTAIKRGRTDAQRRSKDQEDRSAKRNQARRVPGSGSSYRAKGDVKDPGRLHGECKHTVNRTTTLKLDDLLKAERESTMGERVLFEVEFQSVHPYRRFVVLSDEAYQTLLGQAEEEV